MIVTAPLAGIEKVSPVVADKISHGADVIAQQLQHARDQAAPVAASYLEQAKQTAQAYLPTALGGNVSSSASGQVGRPADSLTLPQVTQQQAADRTAELANSAKATAADTTNVAAAKAQDAGSATTSTLSNAAQQAAATAKAYLPESVGNKLPGGAATTSTSTTSTTTSVDSPYVNRSADKVRSSLVLVPQAHIDAPHYAQPTSTLPSTTLEGLSGDKAVVPDFSSGTGTSKQFSGLQPATTDSLASTNTLGSTSTGALKSTDTFGSTGALHSTGTLGSTGTSVEHPTRELRQTCAPRLHR